MGDTTALLDEVAPEMLVSPHVYDEDGRVVKNDYFPYTRVHGPCNNLYTSVDDLSRLALAHLNRGELDGTRILSAAAYDEMWTPYSETGWAGWFGPISTSYGLGWFMGEEGGHDVYHHMGGDEGFQAHIESVAECSRSGRVGAWGASCYAAAAVLRGTELSFRHNSRLL